MQEQPSKVDAASRLTSPARPLAFPFACPLITSQLGGSHRQRSGTTLPFAASMDLCFDLPAAFRSFLLMFWRTSS